MLSVREQPSFAAGMYQSVASERIPENGAWDIENGLLEEDGAADGRGGSTYFSTALSSADLTWIWSGYVGASKLTLVADASDYGNVSGGAIANLGGAGRNAPAGRAAVMGTDLYLPGGVETITSVPAVAAAPAKVAPYYAVVANRLLAGNGRRVDFSGIGTPGTFGATDYHELPDGVSITGMEGLRDSAVCFTTHGIYIISGLALNLTDATGNVQQRIDRYSRDGVLWGDAGIAGWEGGLVAPMRDGVWLISLGVASEAVQAYRLTSGPIADRYKSYVDAGCEPGGAAIFHGHYILPVVLRTGGVTAWVDTLVCRLDLQGTPWSRATGMAFNAVTATPDNQLLAAGSAGRVVQLNWFDGLAATDANGSAVSFRLRTRDMTTGRRKSAIVKLRAQYELASLEARSLLASDALNTVSAALNGRVAALGGPWVTGPDATDFSVGVTGAVRGASGNTQYAVVGHGSVLGKTQAKVQVLLSGKVNGGVLHRYVDNGNHFRAVLVPAFGTPTMRVDVVLAGVPVTVLSAPTSVAAFGALLAGAYLRCEATAAGVWTVSIITTGGLVAQRWTGTHAALAIAGALGTGDGGIVDFGTSTGSALRWSDYSVFTSVLTDATLDCYWMEGPTAEGYQVETLLGSAPSNLLAGAEPGTYTYPVGQSARYGRFEFRCDDPVSRLSLRGFELFVRDAGRQ